MIWDCFTYFNESDVLRMRFNELDKTGCIFVVVEADETFSGESKPFYFDDLPDWVDQWKDRIVRVKISLKGIGDDAWEREAYQRNAILRGLENAKNDDMILISDADEIPRAENLGQYYNPVQLDVKQYFWKLNWQVPDHCNQGARPVYCRMEDLTTPQEMREAVLPRIPYGGWHFSFLTSAEDTKKKISAFAHQEYNELEYTEATKINHRIEKGIDPFDRFPLKLVKFDSSYPSYVEDNFHELTDLIHQP
jgi:hypothetical protein